MNTLGMGKDVVEVKGLMFSNSRFYDCNIELTLYEKIDFLSQNEYIDIAHSDIYNFLRSNFYQEDIRDLTKIILKNNTLLINRGNGWVIERSVK